MMGVYVPFMYMPNNCKQCLVNDSCIFLKTTSSTITDHRRPVDCPLTEAKVDSRFSGAEDAVKLNIENIAYVAKNAVKQNIENTAYVVKDAVKQNIKNTAYVAKQMYDECKFLGFNDKQAFQMATLYLKMKSGEDKVWVK